MELLEKVREVASKAREWAEIKQRKYQFLFRPDLCGMCAKASGYLFELLSKEGIKAKIAINDKHCFVIVNDYIVDITATQYGREKIYIIPLAEAENQYYNYWTVTATFDNIEVVRNYQESEGWAEHQMVCIM